MGAIRRLIWPGVATLGALAILLSLGLWQLARKVEKEAQLQGLREAAEQAPIPLRGGVLLQLIVRAAGSQSRDDDALPELARVSVSGRYLEVGSVPVRASLPAVRGGATSGLGFFWMTPLATSSGEIVFVNRGFVPSGGDWRPPAIPVPAGEQTIVGLLRKPEIPGLFSPSDVPVKGDFFHRDPVVMSLALGLAPERVARFFIDAERAPGDLTPPVGVDPREMIARIPNNHLQYAVTWFGFALTLIVIFALFARARLKESA